MKRTSSFGQEVVIIKEVETGGVVERSLFIVHLVVERSLFSVHLVVERSRNHHQHAVLLNYKFNGV